MAVKAINAVVVLIEDDQQMVIDFLDWSLKNRIFTIRTTGGWTGRGGHCATYPAEHAGKIRSFFAGRGVKNDDGKPFDWNYGHPHGGY